MLVTEQMKTACLEPQFSGVTSEESLSPEWKVCPNLCLWRFPLFDKGWANIVPIPLIRTQFSLLRCQPSQYIQKLNVWEGSTYLFLKLCTEYRYIHTPSFIYLGKQAKQIRWRTRSNNILLELSSFYVWLFLLHLHQAHEVGFFFTWRPARRNQRGWGIT